MFNPALHGQIIPTILLTVRKPGHCLERRSHNYVGDILANCNQVCFLFKQGVPSGFVSEMTGGEPERPSATNTLTSFANMALSAATGVAESHTGRAFTPEGLFSLGE